MKKITLQLLSLFILLSFSNCEKETVLCIADASVELLEAPASVLNGDVIGVFCVIKNVIEEVEGCTSSGEGSATVTCAYSPDFENDFAKYIPFNSYTVNMQSLEKDEIVADSMWMKTEQGSGYYAMKVEVNYPEDEVGYNNKRTVVIQAK